MSTKSTEILFEKFEIIDCLKKDGQAGVYLATHIYLGKRIILKTLNTSALNDSSILERFKREAKILAQLNHPNIIKVLDFGTYENYFYISFEHFESSNLREVINKNNLTDEEKINLIVQLLNALNTAHKNQIIHRDIKPENILVNSNLELKIADFGLALVINENSLTNNTAILGTPSYMAPEQINGEKTFQTDIFSAGLVAYELFTGINPVLGSEVAVTINNIINFDEKKLKAYIEKIPYEIRPAISLMLHKSLEKRAKNIDQVLDSLGTRKEGVPIAERKKRFYLRKSYIYIFLILIISISMLLIWYGSKQGNDFNKLVNQNSLENNNEGNLKNNSTFSSNISKESKNKAEKNLGDKNLPKETNNELPGKLVIDCFPWAEVYIDNKKIDKTPLKNDIVLNPGIHLIKFVHPDYPPIIKKLDIVSQKTETIKINFQDLVGYLDCNIYPWGNIFIDGKFVGITPLRKPIALLPGKYKVTVNNSQYEPISQEITIDAQKTYEFNYNFTNNNK